MSSIFILIRSIWTTKKCTFLGIIVSEYSDTDAQGYSIRKIASFNWFYFFCARSCSAWKLPKFSDVSSVILWSCDTKVNQAWQEAGMLFLPAPQRIHHGPRDVAVVAPPQSLVRCSRREWALSPVPLIARVQMRMPVWRGTCAHTRQWFAKWSKSRSSDWHNWSENRSIWQVNGHLAKHCALG